MPFITIRLVSALFLAVAMAVTTPRPLHACTAFALPGHGVVAKSYDWHIAEGFLMVNKRGVQKRALLLSPKQKAASWVSRYGSVTFNQYGRAFPNGGINEKGLVVEILWLNATRYAPIAADQAAVNELQWIQLLLDRAATLDEALALNVKYGIVPVHARVHYFVCDAKQRCATFEHLGGKRVVHHGAALAAPALTNHRYARALGYWRGGGSRHGRGSLARFAKAADATRRAAGKKTLRDPVQYAFRALEAVQSGSYSKWQIVYEQQRKVVHFRQAGAKKTQLRVDLAALRFDCGSAIRFADLTGAVSKERGLQSWTAAKNAHLVRLTLAKLGLPKHLQRFVAAYPRQLRCAPAR